MSKGRVWNKGKRNGGGGPIEGNKELAEAKAKKKIALELQEVSADGSVNAEVVNPINLVKRMNREEWVTRPARVKPENRE
ncbi:MAG: hypothetical protein WD469_05430 [Paenibacillaceae bacterium]